MKSPLCKKPQGRLYLGTQFIGIPFLSRDADVEYFRPIRNVREGKGWQPRANRNTA